MPSLSMELDEFLCIEERYKRSAKQLENEQQANVIIDLEEL